MQSLVLGATGTVGGYIVQHLVKSGGCPMALSRSLHRSTTVNWLQGDLVSPGSLRFPPFETLYCTADIGLLADAFSCIYAPSLNRVVAFTTTSIVTKIDSEIARSANFWDGLRRGRDC
jgi:hypothetical protein